MDKRIVLGTLSAAAAVGVLAGATPSILAAAVDFKRGLMGESPAGAQLSAEAATSVLERPLSTEQQQELTQALLYVAKDQNSEAAQVLGKYAMLGEPRAQFVIGEMYYSGKGLPLDRTEGMRWLQLAAAQIGWPTEQSTYAVHSESSGSGYSSIDILEQRLAFARANGLSLAELNALDRGPAQEYEPARQYRPPMPETYVPPAANRYERSRQPALTLDTESASRRYIGSTISSDSLETTVVANPAGPGLYAGSNGHMYTEAGPNGVIDTQTGQFYPR